MKRLNDEAVPTLSDRANAFLSAGAKALSAMPPGASPKSLPPVMPPGASPKALPLVMPPGVSLKALPHVMSSGASPPSGTKKQLERERLEMERIRQSGERRKESQINLQKNIKAKELNNAMSEQARIHVSFLMILLTD